jgi:flagellar basal-body rod protein FlgB
VDDMSLLSSGIFDLAEQRLGWLDRRQQVLAQNVANADTPHYQPKDLPDFAASLQNVSSQSAGQLAQTAPGHLAGTVASAVEAGVTGRPEKARAPDGNGVALDEELTKVADVQNMQALTSELYTKYMGMFRQALGKSS